MAAAYSHFRVELPFALAMGCLATLAAPALAQTAGPQPQEETLEDGQVVTRITPGQRPKAIPLAPRASDAKRDDAGPNNPIIPEVASVLAILAHPDDELIMAPVLARIAREKGEVTLVFATSGDAGPGNSGLEPGAKLATLRENEARCSAFALGIEEPIFWRFGDGTLAGEARNTQSQMRDMSERIAGLIALQKPNVIMTWGPDGGYGHADHRITSNAVTQVVQAMGPERPDLLYAAFPAASDPEEGELAGFDGWARLHPSLVTNSISYELPDLDATIAAVDCYESQFAAAPRRVLAGTLHERIWRGQVPFRLAFPRER
ncbi:hypothetical protein EH31_15120 [Erythrobacter longus]|uniref:GlcNAc-PI de-N-acetylase n=1 Tax=Erythrobacter longus TaxID=1044 RepID=A0A074M7R1_ERYLO|nr:PIG-L family deacetylase [Erythrobacter longus]KEO88765.1 hypothetical protein EH31_15120 [Erythrobacter longus]